MVASHFGDNTAKRLGRVTLNPLPHMDLIGTLFLPAAGILSGGFLIGWGKPVPVDYRNLKDWKRDGFFIAAAGPVSNMILALILAGVYHGIMTFYPQVFITHVMGATFLAVLMQAFYLNLALAFFNLIPVHPLDGGKIFYGILPQPLANKFDEVMTRYGFMILIALFISGALQYLVGYPIKIIAGFLL